VGEVDADQVGMRGDVFQKLMTPALGDPPHQDSHLSFPIHFDLHARQDSSINYSSQLEGLSAE